jgi:AcrR family transcriptional regulator
LPQKPVKKRKSASSKGTAVPDSTTARRYEARRREITDAAAVLFAEQGYEATTFRDIADAVGLLKGSLYYYAPSKEDLLYSVVREVQQNGRILVDRFSSSDLDTVSKLRGVIGEGVAFIIQNRLKNIVSLRDFRSLSDEKQNELKGERVAIWDYIRQLITTGMGEGTIRSDVDVAVIATAITGAINYLPTWYESGKPPSVSRMVEGYSGYLIEGLLV